ncbi:MAG TPA: response regulator [Gemmatimonadales bacterium]
MTRSATSAPIPVLVVDDDRQLLRTLADILRLHGYDPLTAQDGQDALRVMHERPVALAVVDLRLPDMDGLELVHRLHELSELTQIVILTGNATVESAVAALRERSVDYLVKPIAPRDLLRTVASAGERWQRRIAEEELERALEAVRVSEERYRSIVETAREGVCTVGVDGRITYANEQMARILGRTTADELLGEAFVEMIAVEERAVAARLLREPSQQGEDREFRLLRPDGATVWAWIAVSLLTDQSGVRSGILAMVTDTTERRQLEERIRRVQKLDAVGRLASGIAHDFNNILTIILAEAEFAIDTPDIQPQVAQSLADIRKAATSAAGLTRQLLTFSRANPVQQGVFSLNDLMADIEGMLHRLIGAGVELIRRPDPGLLSIKADRGQIEQVVTHLVVNARDAMPGGGQVCLATYNLTLDPIAARAQPGLTPGTYAVLTVSDTGTGMSEETKSHLFEPFFTTKAAGKGTGLGLATSYGIVKRCGGHIAVYSEIGRGTTFRVFIPATGQPADVDAAAADAALPRGTEWILLVEDKAEVRSVGARMLRGHGYQVLEAGDADEALRVLDATGTGIRMLLTDVVLPGTGGELLAATVRRLIPGIRVIFTSGYPEDSAFQPGNHPAADAFIQKPLTASTLLPLIRRVLDLPND